MTPGVRPEPLLAAISKGPPCEDEEAIGHFAIEIVINLAGMIGEMIASDFDGIVTPEDYSAAIQLSQYIVPQDKDFSNEEEIAEAAAEIVVELWGRTAIMLFDCWPVVEAVAETLYDKKTLTGKQVRDIVYGVQE